AVTQTGSPKAHLQPIHGILDVQRSGFLAANKMRRLKQAEHRRAGKVDDRGIVRPICKEGRSVEFPFWKDRLAADAYQTLILVQSLMSRTPEVDLQCANFRLAI